MNDHDLIKKYEYSRASDMDDAEFKGYLKATLENINSNIIEIKETAIDNLQEVKVSLDELNKTTQENCLDISKLKVSYKVIISLLVPIFLAIIGLVLKTLF